MAPTGPFKLVTVNTAPDRARRLIGRVVEDVKEKYTIIHAGNADSTCHSLVLMFQAIPNMPLDIEQVRGVVEEQKPDVLVSD